MKTKYYLMMAAASLLMSNCSQEETPSQSQAGSKTLTATIEGSSRSAVTDGGVFSWTSGDEISVWVGNKYDTYTFDATTTNSFNAPENAGTPTGYAIYPAHTSHGDGDLSNGGLPTVMLASSYQYGSTNAPMLAKIDGSTLAFKHLGGLMRFVVKDVPNSTTSFKFTANKKITGDFAIETIDGENVIKAADNGEGTNEITIYYEIGEIKDMTFYVPLPVGEYSGYTVSVGDKSHTTDATVVNTINRGSLLLMPTFTYTDTGLEKSTDNVVMMNAGEEVSLDVNGGEEVVVEITEGATATLNLTAAEGTTDGTVSISDGSAEGTESTTSAGTLNVAAENVANLNINAPTLTVNLTSGTYGTVEALTATNTLIIGEGVTIGELVVKGGNVTLEGDVTLSEPLVVNQDMTLDLGGNTLTANNSGAIVVANGTFTVKNGTIDASTKGCDAVAIKGATESSVIKVDVAEDATLKGGDCCVVVYGSNKSKDITINTAGTLVTESAYESSSYPGYAAISANGNSEGVKLNVTGGSITAKVAAIYFPCSTTLTITGGEITGATAVYQKSGKLTISGGKLTGNGEKKDYVYNGNGCNETGDALVIEACNYPKGNPTVEITGGEFISTNASAIGSYVAEDGGHDTSNPNPERIIGFVKGGTFHDASAFDFLDSEAEVTLGADMVITKAVTISDGISATVNLNGKTIENKTAGHPSMISPEVDDECVVFMVKNGTLTINGEGNVKATGDGVKSDYNVAVWAMGENSNAIINGGTYTNSKDTDDDGCDLIYGRNGAKIEINGGSFQSYIRSTLGGGIYDVLDCKDYKEGSFAQSTITVNGGKFQNYVPSYENVGENEVVLGTGKAVYNGEVVVTTKHDTEGADVWYEVK